MTFEIVTIRCLSDNYAFLLHEKGAGRTTLVDAPEAGPIRAELDRRGWTLDDILLTHHHDDHIAGLADLRAGMRRGARVIGAAADAHRLPPLDLAVAPGDTVTLGTAACAVIAADGHTVGHVAFHIPDAGAVFTGDSLMTHGCGRLFEGTPAQMTATLAALAALPDDTHVFAGHDYARANLAFASLFAPDPQTFAVRQRAVTALTEAGQSTTGTTLATEKALNPYLRLDRPGLRAVLDMADAPDAAVLAELRRRKDTFRG